MTWRDGLSGAALDIAAYRGPRLRVVAGPGTGKTFAMMALVRRLLEEGVAPDRIFVVTFTRTAAADLLRSLRELKVPGCDEVKASTLHSFSFGALSNESTFEDTNRVPRILLKFETAILANDLADAVGGIRKAHRMLKAFESAWATLQVMQPREARSSDELGFEKELESWLRFHRAMLLEELIPTMLAYMRTHPDCAESRQYEHVLADEYQDLNKAEQVLIDLLAKNASLAIFGDGDQSIYKFKFAHPEGIADFSSRHKDVHDLNLADCRRCPVRIVNAAKALMEKSGEWSGRSLKPTSKAVGELHVVRWADSSAEAQGLARLATDLVRRRSVKPGEILILLPRAALAPELVEQLTLNEIPVRTYFAEDALDSTRARQAFTLLNLLVHPNDLVSVRAWMAYGGAESDPACWAMFRKYCKLRDAPIRELLGTLSENSLAFEGSAYLGERYSVLENRLTKLAGLEGRPLVDALFPESVDDLAQLRRIALSLIEGAQVASALLEALRGVVIRPEVPLEADFIRVMTPHKSKGLTVDWTLIGGCVEGYLPTLPRAGESDEAEGGIEEARRAMFVALTRSRMGCVLSRMEKLEAAGAHRTGARGRVHRTVMKPKRSRFIEDMSDALPAEIEGKALSLA